MVSQYQYYLFHDNVIKLTSKFRSCKQYPKPIENISLRFNTKYHENVKSQNCLQNDIENYIATRTPLKLKDCFDRRQLESFANPLGIWDSHVKDEIDDEVRSAKLFSKELFNLIESRALVKGETRNKSSILDRLPYSEIDKYHPKESIFKFNSRSTGDLFQIDNLDKFYYQQNGSNWIILVPHGPNKMVRYDHIYLLLSLKDHLILWVKFVCQDLECQINCNKFKPNIIYDGRIWFNNFQPQLLKKRFFGREVMHTILKEGEVLFVPSKFIMFSYAIESSVTITRKFLSSNSLDTYLSKKK